MNEVVKILMELDEIDQETAEALVRETRNEILNAENVFDADDIIMDYLGLEPDYIFDILDMK